MLAGVRRLTLLADGAPNPEAIFRALARELLIGVGAEEVHVHHLAAPDEQEELVAVYMFEGDGRLSVVVNDWQTGDAFEIDASGQNALEVFNHPFAYRRAA